MPEQANFPLYKNAQASCYETVVNGYHILVPFTEFEYHMKTLTEKYMQELGMDASPASNKAFFELIDASYWNDGHHVVDKEPWAPSAPLEASSMQLPPGEVWSCQIELIMGDPQGEARDETLEGMEKYFHDLYMNAPKGSKEEASKAAIYTQVVQARTMNKIGRMLARMTDMGEFYDL